MKLNFYKKDNRWFADIAGHTEEENEMVFGADLLLDIIAKGANTCSLDIGSQFISGCNIEASIYDHNDEGATYVVYDSDIIDIGTTFWLCNITHTVFGEHPDKLFIKV